MPHQFLTPSCRVSVSWGFGVHVFNKDAYALTGVFQPLCFTHGSVTCQNIQEQSGGRPRLHHPPTLPPQLSVTHDWDSPLLQTHTPSMLFLPQLLASLLRPYGKIYFLLTLTPFIISMPSQLLIIPIMSDLKISLIMFMHSSSKYLLNLNILKHKTEIKSHLVEFLHEGSYALE